LSLAVTCLTGRRPHLLERTLASVEAHQSVLADAWWLVCHNGGDEATWEVLQQHRDLVNQVVVTPHFMDVGPATSFLFHHAAETRHLFLFHLEDDWVAEPGDWLVEAGFLLAEGAFQVRLRHHEERVLPRHMVTNRRLNWRSHKGYNLTEDAHYTLNPSLMYVDDLRLGFPATSERDAQRKFWERGRRRVAQLVPGVWRHIGEGKESLRRAWPQ
jgi:hypothetical protein